MYSTIVVIIFTVPLKLSWSEQLIVSDENVWRLLHIGAALPQMRHKHVSAR